MTVVPQPLGDAAPFRLLRRVAVLGVWVLAPMALSAAFRMMLIRVGVDAHAYWLAARGMLSYHLGPGHVDAFLYSPIFADVIRPLGLLPWPAFWGLWAVIEGAVLVWLLAPLGASWAVPLWLLCTPELVNGNIYILLAAASVLGMRYPQCWSFPVLTKVASGVGLLWFVARGEWRRLAIAGASILAVVGVGLLLQPDAWITWIGFLVRSREASNDGEAGLALRAVLASLLTVYAAKRDARWLIPVAMVAINPIAVLTMLTMLTAIPRMVRAPAVQLWRIS